MNFQSPGPEVTKVVLRMDYEQYQKIKLKDGRDGFIVEILSPTDFIVDVGSSPKDWETISVKADEIAEQNNTKLFT